MFSVPLDRIRPAVRRLAPAFLLLAMAGLAASPAAPTPRAAVPSTAVLDPQMGPHAIDEARHKAEAKLLPPARSTPIPLARGMGGRMAAHIAAATPTPFHREVFGFAPYWSLSQYTTWDYRLLSTVAYFGITLDGGGNIDTTAAGYNQFNSQDFVNMVNAAHAQGARVVLVIKQFNQDSINRIVTDPALSQVAITNAMNLVAAKNLDGVNVDFEASSADPPYIYIQSGMTSFMSKLSQQMHAQWPTSEVSIDTYTGSASWDGGVFKIGDLAPVVDAFFIMSYDMVFSNQPGVAGANAPLTHFTYNDTDAVAQYLSKAPASKILLGVPYYGYKWDTTGNAPNSPTSGGATADTYANIVSELQCPLQYESTGWDSFAQSPWVAWYSPATNDPCGGNNGSWRELYYDSAASLGLKYDLVNNNNLRGAGMWALGYDGGATELWNEIAQKLTTVTVWDPTNGFTNAAPGVGAASTTKVDAVIRGTDGAIWHSTWNGTAWGAWESLGGTLASRPTAVDLSPTRVDVFARGMDNALWHRMWNGTAWQAWESLGGNLTSGPGSATWSATRMDVFVRGTDQALWHRSWNGTSWSGWDSVGGVLTSDPAAVSWTNGRLDVFVRGTDGALWHRAYELGGWGAWESLGGTLVTAPAVASCGAIHLEVFAVGVDRALWSRTFNQGGWGQWQSQGGQWAAGPSAACEPGTSTVDVLERAQDGQVWHTTVTAS